MRYLQVIAFLVVLMPTTATAGGWGCWICEYAPTTTGNRAWCDTPADGHWGTGIKCSEVSLGNYQDCLITGGMCLYTVVTPSKVQAPKPPALEQHSEKKAQEVHLF